jgi:hypothetical protein
MKELLRCRAMERMCLQRASLYPQEGSKFLAEAEMWRKQALALIAEHHAACNQGNERLSA